MQLPCFYAKKLLALLEKVWPQEGAIYFSKGDVVCGQKVTVNGDAKKKVRFARRLAHLWRAAPWACHASTFPLKVCRDFAGIGIPTVTWICIFSPSQQAVSRHINSSEIHNFGNSRDSFGRCEIWLDF